ncbi:molybdenum cofactor guanylyltransferase [Asticcacaulis tiandongensis]|uniref:molybdenum cofactor guanylyltransferase n=1 Tax=Asticcacaulis tiandongensis TaxID=2565365 RepID=UPI00112C8D41|nr:molybdenum cofactor guanylyltransferase [Asticcacaulis tiandongensis]
MAGWHVAGRKSLMRISGVILCGGKSSRMGQDKAGLMWQGHSWLDHTARTLRDAGAENIYVSGERDGYPSVPDRVEGRGPAAAICSCILHIEDAVDALLFVPVDMPLLEGHILSVLPEGLGDAQAVVFGDLPLPLCLRFDAALKAYCHAQLERIAAGDKGSVKGLIAGLVTRRLEALKPEALRNFNRPQDIETYLLPG